LGVVLINHILDQQSGLLRRKKPGLANVIIRDKYSEISPKHLQLSALRLYASQKQTQHKTSASVSLSAA